MVVRPISQMIRPDSAASSTELPTPAAKCWRVWRTGKSNSRPTVSSPKRTVAVIRADLLPALLADAIHSHRAAPTAEPARLAPRAPLIKPRTRVSPARPAPTYMNTTATRIDEGRCGQRFCQLKAAYGELSAG